MINTSKTIVMLPAYKACPYSEKESKSILPINDLPVIKVDVTYNVPISNRPQLSSSMDCLNVFRQTFPSGHSQLREVLQILFLASDNRLLGYDTSFLGGATRMNIDPKYIFQLALATNCHAIVLGHNHPMASSMPSKNDINITNRIVELCGLFDLVLLDHIILGETDYFSFNDNSLISRQL